MHGALGRFPSYLRVTKRPAPGEATSFQARNSETWGGGNRYLQKRHWRSRFRILPQPSSRWTCRSGAPHEVLTAAAHQSQTSHLGRHDASGLTTEPGARLATVKVCTVGTPPSGIVVS